MVTAICFRREAPQTGDTGTSVSIPLKCRHDAPSGCRRKSAFWRLAAKYENREAIQSHSPRRNTIRPAMARKNRVEESLIEARAGNSRGCLSEMQAVERGGERLVIAVVKPSGPYCVNATPPMSCPAGRRYAD